jgi:hypothetical protein
MFIRRGAVTVILSFFHVVFRRMPLRGRTEADTDASVSVSFRASA